jgi:hypothetical protein
VNADVVCSDSSLAAGEPLAGTATEAASWLLVEVRGAWGRDAVADTDLPTAVRGTLDAFPGKVVLVRRPDRRQGVMVIRAVAAESGGFAVRQELDSLDALPGADLDQGEPVVGPLVLVCAHGRRDACCARLGPPLFEALALHLPREQLWQSSHLGGHRFAPNVLVLPHGIQLGRLPLDRVPEVVDLLAHGRIPLDLYRGRTIYGPAVQAAEIAVRSQPGCDGLGDLRLISDEGNLVTFSTPVGEVTVRVEEQPGPVVAVSCGAEPEPTTGWATSLVSAS